MLIKNDRSLLGDGVNGSNLRNKEAFDRIAEDTERKLETYKLSGMDELVQAERRAGHRMHHMDFLLKLNSLQLNPPLVMQQSVNYEQCLGLYLEQPDNKLKYLTYVTKGWMPEFSYLLTDGRGLPTHKVMGWRNVIVELLKHGAIKWNQAKFAFGDVMNLNSERWEKETRPYRT